MRKNTLHPQIEVLLDAIDLAFDHRAWHGPNLRGSIRGVTSREAAWRPGSGRHNIWELVVHAAYWKYAARRRLRGDRFKLLESDRGSCFPRYLSRGSNSAPKTALQSAPWVTRAGRLSRDPRPLHSGKCFPNCACSCGPRAWDVRRAAIESPQAKKGADHEQYDSTQHGHYGFGIAWISHRADDGLGTRHRRPVAKHYRNPGSITANHFRRQH